MIIRNFDELLRRAKSYQVILIARKRGEPVSAIVYNDTLHRRKYAVTVDFHGLGIISSTCTCHWGKHGHSLCSHALGVLNEVWSRKGAAFKLWGSVEEAEALPYHRLFYCEDTDGLRVYITTHITNDKAA